MRIVVGVMGGSTADSTTSDMAFALGRLIAERGWVLLNGGRACGVMEASARGAREAGGLVVGILPDDDDARASRHLDVAVITGIGDARNYVNVLSSRVVIAMRGGAGTLSEIALALKSGRPVITLDFPLGIAFEGYRESGSLTETATPEEAVATAARLLGE